MEENPWRVLARRIAHASDWIDLQLVDVRLPDGSVLRDVHFLDFKRQAAGVVPIRADGKILLIDHYRFQTDTRGWEIPAGRMDDGETPEQAVARELMEETGHRAEAFKVLGRYHPSNGSSNQVFNIFVARGVARVGDIEDTNEVMGWRWFSASVVRELIARNEILDGLSLTGLLWASMAGEI